MWEWEGLGLEVSGWAARGGKRLGGDWRRSAPTLLPPAPLPACFHLLHGNLRMLACRAWGASRLHVRVWRVRRQKWAGAGKEGEEANLQVGLRMGHLQVCSRRG
jgi:hypothetical protein